MKRTKPDPSVKEDPEKPPKQRPSDPCAPPPVGENVLIDLTEEEEEEQVPLVEVTASTAGRGEQPVESDIREFEGIAGSACVTGQSLPPVSQPPSLLPVLRDYQLAALAWMRNQEKSGPGGILADEMGLGKTVETLALILGSIEERRTVTGSCCTERGEVPPDSPGPTLVISPVTALQHWSSELVAHVRRNAKVSWMTHHGTSRSRDVEMISSQDIVLTSFSTCVAEFDEDPRNRGPLFQVQWYRVVLDEAHFIRNTETRCYAAVCQLKCRKRWCVTGTPVQNSLFDLWSILSFVSDEVMEKHTYKASIVDAVRCGSSEGRLALHDVLDKWMLRRLKSSLIEGKSIIRLPQLNIIDVKVILPPEARIFYDRIFESTKAEIRGLEQEKGGLANNIQCVLELIIRLRQLVDHPFISLRSVSFPEDAIAHKWNFPALRKKLDEVVGQSRATVMEAAAETVETEVTAAAGAPRSAPVIDLDGDGPGSSSVCDLCLLSGCLVKSSCGHFFCEDCSVVLTLCPLCGSTIVKAETPELPGLARKRSKQDPEETPRVKPEPVGPAPVKCAKIEAIVQLLQKHASTDKELKAVIFSQFVSFIDLIEMRLMHEGWPSMRMDGSCPIGERMGLVEQFRDRKGPIIFLMSVRVGGCALNLVSSNVVIISEPWWNPAVDRQAIERVHRLGQERDVFGYRLIVRDSIEEKMLQIQEGKQAIADIALTRAGSPAVTTRFLALVRKLFH